MSSSGQRAHTQARALLQALCRFILPLVQSTNGETIMDPMKMPWGIEAEELTIELENFMTSMILSSQLDNKDYSIDAPLQDGNVSIGIGSIDTDRDEVKDSTATFDRGSNDENRILVDRSIINHPAVPRLISQSSNDEDNLELTLRLGALRNHVAQNMPIRLLQFEPHNSKLKISLLDKSGIYDYLEKKLLAGYFTSRSRSLWIENNAGYAILSHTWSQRPGEFTYRDWEQGLLFNAEEPKCQKLVNFCRVAWEKHGLALGWIDTVCINKESSAELDESIRSMYAWYNKATICVTYLEGTTELLEMHSDRWFGRGWTFQELVAPLRIKFYNMHWRQFIKASRPDNDKRHPLILGAIERATTIRPHELVNIRLTSISRRIQLASMREVTRKEDMAYSLMGIFNVSISTAYGEGPERAFFRFLKEIFDSTKDVSDILNWGGNLPSSWTPITSLFPSRPSDFISRSPKVRPWHPIKPLTLTHLGLRTSILLMPAITSHDLVSDHQPIGDYYATVQDLHPTLSQSDSIRYSDIPKIYNLLDNRISEPGDMNFGNRPPNMAWTFGTLNVEAHETIIHVPKTCLAVLLQHQTGGVEASPTSYKKIYTYRSIVFDLKKNRNAESDSSDKDKHYYQIEKHQLGIHGMQLVTLYL